MQISFCAEEECKIFTFLVVNSNVWIVTISQFKKWEKMENLWLDIICKIME